MEVLTERKYASWGDPKVQELRKEAILFFENNQLPEVKVELYKYSNIKRLFDTHGYSSSEGQSAPYVLADIPVKTKASIVIKNGKLEHAPEIEGLKIFGDFHTLQEHEMGNIFHNRESDVMKALMLATANEGVFIEVEDNAHLSEPVLVYLVNDGAEDSFLSQLHVIKSGKNSKASFIICHINTQEKANFNLISWHCFVEENASLSLFDEQLQKDKDSAVFGYSATQDRGSNWSFTQAALHGAFSRTNIFAHQKGEAAHTELNGVFMPSETQHFDIHSLILHDKPHGTSDELYKGIASGNGKGFFNGKVFVARDAQKINAYQSNKNIILGKEATINSKPELEIYADDVKCSHGSTTGQLDDNALFYLQARGIRKSEASKLLLEAFASDVFERIDNEEIKEWMRNKLAIRF